MATEAALDAYTGGVVDRVVKLSNGEYEVHYIGVNWPHHTFVNQDVKVPGPDALQSRAGTRCLRSGPGVQGHRSPVKQFPSLANPISAACAAQATLSWPSRDQMFCPTSTDGLA
jgi:hypothetical protein